MTYNVFGGTLNPTLLLLTAVGQYCGRVLLKYSSIVQTLVGREGHSGGLRAVLSP